MTPCFSSTSSWNPDHERGTGEDQVAFLLMAVPLYGPLVTALGFDPVWFWTLFLVNLILGSITPPFGYILFDQVSAAPGLGHAVIFRASLPVIELFLLSMAILHALPGLVTWLPERMRRKPRSPSLRTPPVSSPSAAGAKAAPAPRSSSST